ncbi:hypothetical protein EJ02DRAFT_445433 [Clathrospora elynae]|uniref:Uncharacterized protein n=1 Tax=Clathrospora elynae TaxID=706981 RepID=A0A6A5SM93_9PLEO|nr:hypothetical protein EJ02DRAFT_445433 [Clathrospora elynae]
MFPFPSELIAEIGSHLESATDFMNMRLVNKYVCNSLKPVLYRSIADNRTIFPRYESIAHFLSLLNSDSKHVLHKYVRSITLVAEGLRQHEYGYGWAWEQLQDWENVSVTENDMEIIDEINNRHANELSFNESYYNGGGYRTMLGHLLALLPNLRTITVRKLKVGEHVPGWNGSKLLQSLSFFYEGLNTNEIFYGDWNYDTVHKCVTCYTDEYGEEIVEPGAGPQASFIDDLKAAMEISETFAGIEFAV